MLGKAGIRLPPGPRRTLEDFARSPPATDRRRSLTGSPHRPQPRSAPWRNPVRRRFRTRRRAVRVRWAPGCIGQRPLDDLGTDRHRSRHGGKPVAARVRPTDRCVTRPAGPLDRPQHRGHPSAQPAHNRVRPSWPQTGRGRLHRPSLSESRHDPGSWRRPETR